MHIVYNINLSNPANITDERLNLYLQIKERSKKGESVNFSHLNQKERKVVLNALKSLNNNKAENISSREDIKNISEKLSNKITKTNNKSLFSIIFKPFGNFFGLRTKSKQLFEEFKKVESSVTNLENLSALIFKKSGKFLKLIRMVKCQKAIKDLSNRQESTEMRTRILNFFDELLNFENKEDRIKLLNDESSKIKQDLKNISGAEKQILEMHQKILSADVMEWCENLTTSNKKEIESLRKDFWNHVFINYNDTSLSKNNEQIKKIKKYILETKELLEKSPLTPLLEELPDLAAIEEDLNAPTQ